MTDPPLSDHVEIPPSTPSTIGLWTAVLSGPVAWIAHFGVVYFGAEWVCASERTGGTIGMLGTTGLVVLVVAATVVGVAITAWSAAICRRIIRQDDEIMGWTGLLLALGSMISILVVGLPTLVVGTC